MKHALGVRGGSGAARRSREGVREQPPWTSKYFMSFATHQDLNRDQASGHVLVFVASLAHCSSCFYILLEYCFALSALARPPSGAVVHTANIWQLTVNLGSFLIHVCLFRAIT
jgi:hypothetical protein